MAYPAKAEAVLRLIRATVPEGGGLLALAESYFDETNTHSSSERLCVGGYIFLKDAAEEQTKRWSVLLDRWNIEHFHMVDCAHNAGVFKHLTANECDLAAREAIAIIKETASAGVCVTVLESDYIELVPQMTFLGSAYDQSARDVISCVANWIERKRFSGDMHYFFEAGVDTQNNASHSILQMMKEPDIKREARYAGHSFVFKNKSPGVQAADILAWHAGQDCKRALRGDPTRKDFRSLLDIPHTVVHLTREKLQQRAKMITSVLGGEGLTTEQVDEIDALMRRTSSRKRQGD